MADRGIPTAAFMEKCRPKSHGHFVLDDAPLVDMTQHRCGYGCGLGHGSNTCLMESVLTC
ncbi:hypothetical protein EJ110_NYTH11208 [Nymphaea thermarum]|nr:hypothetical protein EJ110_NYTH11208 [Nymphaea thermarum]